VNLNLIEAWLANVKPVSMRLSQVNILKPAKLLVKKAGEWLHFTLSVFGIILRLVFERITRGSHRACRPPSGLSGQPLCGTVVLTRRQTSEAAFKRSFFE
jgi:hypothetical protein